MGGGGLGEQGCRGEFALVGMFIGVRIHGFSVESSKRIEWRMRDDEMRRGS